MTEKLKQQLELLKMQLAADKKKAAVLGILAVVLLGIVGRLYFSSSSPKEIMASTAPLPTDSATPVSPTPQQAPPTPAATVVAAQTTPTNPTPNPPPTDPGKTGSVSVAGMSRKLSRDLFSSSAWNKFMPAVLADGDGSAGQRSRNRTGFWGNLRRSLDEYEKEQSEFTKTFQHDLEQLLLQSTLTGAKPMAYISGRLVRPGDNIDGFSVVRIYDRRVTLARAGMTASLAMK